MSPLPILAGSNAPHGAVVPIAYTSLSSTNSVLFSNIPQNYQDLRLVLFVRDTASTGYLAIYFKESTYGYSTTNYSQTSLSGNGSAASSSRLTNSNRIIPLDVLSGATSGVFGFHTIDILNYANTSTYKTVLTRGAGDANGSGFVELNASLWTKTDGVSQIGIYTTSGGAGLAAGSTVTLYGVRSIGQ